MQATRKSGEDPEAIVTVPSEVDEACDNWTITHDAVFGDITEDGPNYRNVRSLQLVELSYD